MFEDQQARALAELVRQLRVGDLIGQSATRSQCRVASLESLPAIHSAARR
jgi:hypothetical protein